MDFPEGHHPFAEGQHHFAEGQHLHMSERKKTQWTFLQENVAFVFMRKVVYFAKKSSKSDTCVRTT